jgi:short-subunit dehydrogenase
LTQRVPIGAGDRSTEGRGRTALVTGASSGIGLALSSLLAAKGFNVIPVARRGERLRAMAENLSTQWQVNVDPIVSDLSAAASPRTIVDEIDRRGIHVDFLVNNAGYAFPGAYANTTWQDQERFVRVMALSTLELTHHLLPGMIEHRWGRILNIASISALQSGSAQSVLYCASKSLIHKFTEGLATETRQYGIHCTASMPGFTDTEIFEASGWGEGFASKPIVRAITMAPETVARQAFRAVSQGRPTVVHGLAHKAIGFSWLHLPPALRRKLSSFTADVPVN